MNEANLSKKYKSILAILSERQRRIYLAIESTHEGHGGVI